MADLAELGFKIDTDALKRAADSLGKITKELKPLASAQDAVRKSTDSLTESSDRAEKSAERLNKAKLGLKVAALAITAAVLGAAAAISKLTSDGLKSVDSQAKLARSLQGTADGLRAIQLAASEAGIDGMEGSLNRLNRRLGAAELGVGLYAKSVEALNLDLGALQRMDVDQRVIAIADAVKNSGLSAQVTARHLQQLGFQQAQANEFFRQGGDAVREARKAVDEYGLSMSAVDSSVVEQANDAWGRSLLVIEGVKNKLAVEFAPVLLFISELLQDAAKEGNGFGSAIEVGFEKGLRAVAFMSDAVEGLGRVFDIAENSIVVFVRFTVAEMMRLGEFILAGPVSAINGLISLINELPGINIGRLSVVDDLRREMRQAESMVRNSQRNIQKALTTPFKSVAVLEAFERSKAASKDAATRLAADREIEKKSFKGVADQVAESSKDIAKSTAEVVVALDDSFAAFERLRRRIDPVSAATEDYLTSIKDLDQALADGLIPNADEYNRLLVLLTNNSRDYATSIRWMVQALDDGLISGEDFGRLFANINQELEQTPKIAQAAAREASPFFVAWENALRRLDDAFANVWRGAFESFKSFRRSITAAFKNLLAELAHTALTRPLMLSIGAGLGISPGGAAASGGGGFGLGEGLNLASIGSSIFSTGFGSTTAAGSALMAAGNLFGSTAVTAFGAGLQGGAAGAFLAAEAGGAAASAAAAGATTAAIAGPLLAGIAGIMAGSFIAGDKKIAGLSGTMTAAGGAAAGAAIGTAILPVVGTAIGAVLGGVIGGGINALFGRGPMKQRETELAIGVSPDSVGGATSTRFRAKGGVFRGDKTRFEEAPIGDELQKILSDSVSGFSENLRQVAKEISLDITDFNNFYQEFRIQSPPGEGFSGEQLVGLISDIGEAMANSLLPGLEQFSRGGETALDTISRLSSEFHALVNSASALGLSLAESRLAISAMSIDARSAFIDAAGGMEALAQKVSFFGANFLTEADQLQPAIDMLDERMGALGIAADITKDDFRDLVQSFGQLDGISQELLHGLLDVAPLFVAVTDGLAAMEDQRMEQLAREAEQLAAIADAASLRRAELIDVLFGVNDALKGINVSALDLTESGALAAEQMAIASGGLDRLISFQQSYYQAFFSESERAERTFTNMTEALAEVGLSLPGTRDEFRALVEAQDVMTESGRAALLVLGGVARAFDTLATQAEREAEEALRIAQRSAEEALRAEEERRRLLDAGVSAALSALAASVAAEKALLSERTAAQIASINEEADVRISANRIALDAAKEGLRLVQGELSQIQSARQSLRGSFEPGSGARRSAAVGRLQSAVVTGNLSGAGDAAQIAAEINELDYTSSVDFRIEQGKTLNLLASADQLASQQVDHMAVAVERLEDTIDIIRQSARDQVKQLQTNLARELEALDNLLLTANRQVDALRGVGQNVLGVWQAIAELSRAIRASTASSTIQGFANGGTHMGGLRIVGERGPELEATGPARFMNNSQLTSALQGGDQVNQLRDDLMSGLRAIERNTREIKQIEERWDRIGLPEERVLA